MGGGVTVCPFNTFKTLRSLMPPNFSKNKIKEI
ncbi:hypothetical protein AGR13a_Cc340155 [Agrobacterium genomosp. 13 str. CFBP 6927]|uniref:Uncharacterized protein n=1 Tax=Agrobacterium genomosp. 13 str. CFBP 6927 TaxID=1183428 RepID=A0ABM9VI16_9HYPH|nr:hypothetical protein AGR13a_Cc340155 [Agrobacterium genomosp. 13 str. CFBP 6927]